MDYNFPEKDFYTVPFSQLAHDFALLKVRKNLDDGKISTMGDFMKNYVDELDTFKCYLKTIYGEDIFTK